MFTKFKSGLGAVSSAVSSLFSEPKSNVAEGAEQNTTFFGSSPVTSATSSYISKKPECIKRLAESVKDKSKLMKPQRGPLPVHIIPLKTEHINVVGCRRFSFGKDSPKRNRTIMVLGATGAGKSTLINGMINYILGVEWEDSFRFKLVAEDESRSQAESQTSEVTVYKINHQEGFKIDYSLTIVDTPGFGDTRGIERDKEITEQLRRLFSAKLGVSDIDAVCFVAQASLARLTPTQKYVFDSVLSIFGKDVAENIRILVTFADGQRPPVIEAINVADVPCPKAKDGLPVHFKFNNSALYAHNKSSAANSMNGDDEDDGDFDKMFWNMGTKSMKRFFVALNFITTKSLTMTKEVLREREQLQNSIENLQKQVKAGLAKLEEIKVTAETLKDHEAEISRNENFEFEITVMKPVQADISGSGNFITNCQQCHHTCHYPCGIPNDADKRGCVAMGSDGNCTECPGRCHWNVHFNQRYKWDYEEVIEKQTKKELEKKYLKATEAKISVQGLIGRLHDQYNYVQAEVVKLMEKSANCLNRLKEIALKPNPLSTPEYIDMLIEGEKSEAKPGWKQRIQYLITMREKAEYMAKIVKGEDLLQSPPTSFGQDQAKKTPQQDNSDPNKGQDSEPDTNPDQDKSDSDPNKGQDSEPDTNPDQDKSDSDPNKGQDSESDTNPDQDKSDSDPNKGQDSESDTNPDQDKSDSDPNKGQDSEPDTNPDQDKSDSDPNKGQDSEPDTNPDQDQV